MTTILLILIICIIIIDVLLFRGTEKQHVADDYAERLHIGQVECQEVMSTVLNDLFVKTNAPKMDLSFCEYLNISVCPITESGNVRTYYQLLCSNIMQLLY